MRYNLALNPLLLVCSVPSLLSGSCEGVGCVASAHVRDDSGHSSGIVGRHSLATGRQKAHIFGEVLGGPEPYVDRDTEPERQL